MSKKVFTGSIAILLLSIFLLISGCDDFSLVDVLTRDIFLVPAEITLNLDETIKFEVSSGIAPYEFTEVGNGEVPEGIYTAPSTTGNFIISVRDDRDRIAEAYVTVVEAISKSELGFVSPIPTFPALVILIRSVGSIAVKVSFVANAR